VFLCGVAFGFEVSDWNTIFLSFLTG